MIIHKIYLDHMMSSDIDMILHMIYQNIVMWALMYGVLWYNYGVAEHQDLRFTQPPTRFMACCGPLGNAIGTYVQIIRVSGIIIN